MTGKTLAQLMDLPWSTFARIVARYHGDHSVQTFPCTEQFRAMAFAQLTYRESLRDIEACLSAQPAKLFIWAFADWSDDRRWPMRMKSEIGAFMRSSPSG